MPAVAQITDSEMQKRIESLIEREFGIQMKLGKALLVGDTDAAEELRSERVGLKRELEDCYLVQPHLGWCWLGYQVVRRLPEASEGLRGT